MSAIDKDPFPRWTLFAAATLIVFSLVAAASGRYLNLNAEPSAEQADIAPISVRDLTFADAPDGSVQVLDATGEQIVLVLEPGTNGFIRGVLRGMARARRARGIDQAPPFRLAEWPDGRLSLEDTATGQRIELNSFGADNRAAFARLLVSESQT
ncbi:MAG: hypothetical protein H7124_14705 [Phycisphaerales bacterium]|nr:hypothetical protein [Hyphomonadaceae bacterium]